MDDITMTQSTPVPEAVIEAAYSGEPLDNRPPEAMDGRTVQYIYSYGYSTGRSHAAEAVRRAALTSPSAIKGLKIDREALRRQIERDPDEGEIGVGFELFDPDGMERLAMAALPAWARDEILRLRALAYRITTLERELAESQAHRDTAQSMVQAWVDVFGTIEAHIMDRVYMSDPANPALYLRIIRSGIANIQRSSAQICAARWADNRRQSDQITGLQAEVERLRGLVETAFRDGLSYGTDVWLQAVRRGA